VQIGIHITDDIPAPDSEASTTLAGTERAVSPKSNNTDCNVTTGGRDLVDTLVSLIASKSVPALFELGGIQGLSETLQTDASSGLGVDCHSDIMIIGPDRTPKTRKELFGTNRLPLKKGTTFSQLVWDGFRDVAIVFFVVANMLACIVPLCFPRLQATNDGYWVSAPVALPLLLLGVVIAATIKFNSERQKALLTEKVCGSSSKHGKRQS